MNSSQLGQTESQIVANCTEYLRRSGWMVKVFAQDKPTRRQSAGWVDLAAFKHGVTLLVECKARTGKRREAQTKFYDDLHEHLGRCLRYSLARDVETLEIVTELIEVSR